MSQEEDRVSVQKTYKLYINGGFPRTESGRYIEVEDNENNFLANVCRGSRKDFRDAVVAAREAMDDWSNRSPFNRGQIIYRMAEMLESRRQSMTQALRETGDYSKKQARREVDESIDRLVWYAGWTDKFEQVFGSTNPVASNHFNFTIPEPTGVIAGFFPQTAPLLGVVSSMAPVILTGNTLVGIVDNEAPTIAMEFAEVLNNSDLPAGVVNLITGYRDELVEHVGGHRDVDGVFCFGPSQDEQETLALEGAESVTRVEFFEEPDDWFSDSEQSPYRITPFVEFKTTWHPVGA